MYHEPVMLNESIAGLEIKSGGVYVDATFGGGGHSRKILEQLDETAKLFAIDQDEEAKHNLPDDSRITFIHGNFRYIKNYLSYYNIEKVDGVLADLGVSSHHFDDLKRGFSFRTDAKLDMRMNCKAEKDAAYVLNNYSEQELTNVFRNYGEVDFAYKLAKEVIANRALQDVTNTAKFVELVDKYTNPVRRNKILAQVFQALRIEVNDEVNALSELLAACNDIVASGGRLVVISYHSLEDRLVKNIIKSGNTEGIEQYDLYGKIEGPWKSLTRKPLLASEEELNKNSKSRPAKLRIAQRN